MYYFNLIMFYSLLGFILESVVYKVCNDNKHSGIFYGPYTLVYGFGQLPCIIIFNKINDLIPNIFLKIVLLYLIFIIITTTIEFIGGNLIHLFLNIDKWNYTKHKFHFGKYICLDYALYWGILTLITVYFLHPFFDINIIKKIPNKVSIIILIILVIDTCLVIFKKIKKGKTN